MSGPWRMSPVFVLRHAGMPFEWVAGLGFSDDVVALADDPDPDPAHAAEYERRYAAERDRLRGALHRHARREEFRAAVFLSNPGMYGGMLRGYVQRDEVPDNARFRRVERQVYRYLQRFCAKNETTSTFGPMGYGRVDDGDGLRVGRRPQRRLVLLARWALEELARAAARDPGLRRHVPVRRSALARGDAPSTGTGPDADVRGAVWKALGDGPVSLDGLAGATGTGLNDLAAALRPWLADGTLHRGIVFPAEVVDGLPGLRDAVAELPGVARRGHWLDVLDGFADDCRRFAAAGLPERERLLDEMERRFTELTGAAARRGAGDIYADRLILFEEASSPFEIRIGDRLARTVEDRVCAALELSAHGGARVQDEFRREMAGVLGAAGGRLDFPDYSAAARPDGDLRSEFGGHAHTLTVDAAAGDDVDLPAPDGAGPDRRYALPDLCLCAPDEPGGDPAVVLARVHHHLLLQGWLTTFADEPAEIDRQVRSWLDGSAAGRRTVALATTRRNKGFYRFPGRRVLISPVDHERRDGAVPGTALRVELDGGVPRLCGEDGDPLVLYPMLADLTTYPPVAALTDPPVLHVPVRGPGGSRTLGRVRVDGGAVYQRAGWDLDVTALGTLRGAAAFREMRRLAVRHGLPRFVFVRSRAERKPQLLDTRSPFATELLAQLAGEGSVSAEEMLPGPDDLWLSDERGHYTCELRVQFLRDADGGPR